MLNKFIQQGILLKMLLFCVSMLCLVYPSVCDSQKGQQTQVQPSFPHNEMEALKLEEEYVHKVYEEIATHFSSTRHSPWPRIVEFLRSLPKGSIVADVGCGNGKYLGINEDLYMVSSSYCVLFSLVLVFIPLCSCSTLELQLWEECQEQKALS